MHQNKKSWNIHAQRYFNEHELSVNVVDYCGNLYPNDDDLHLIGNVKGKTVVEIGSGWGNCGIALAKQGAHVTCLDFSEEQLSLGSRLAEREGVSVNFLQSDMADLSAFSNSSIDLVLSICALQYAADLDRVFSEVSRILKTKGAFVFSVEHPIIKALGATELYPEEGADERYLFVGSTEWKWQSEDDFTFVSYRRPVSTFINALAKNGFCVVHMEESLPKTNDPAWTEHEVRLRQRFPSLFIIKAVKN